MQCIFSAYFDKHLGEFYIINKFDFRQQNPGP